MYGIIHYIAWTIWINGKPFRQTIYQIHNLYCDWNRNFQKFNEPSKVFRSVFKLSKWFLIRNARKKVNLIRTKIRQSKSNFWSRVKRIVTWSTLISNYRFKKIIDDISTVGLREDKKAIVHNEWIEQNTINGEMRDTFAAVVYFNLFHRRVNDLIRHLVLSG